MTNEEKKEEIIKYLETVIDPEIFIDIWTMGLVRKIDIIDDKNVNIEMTLTTPTCPLGPQIIEDIQVTLGKIGYETVNVALSFDPPWKAPEDLREMLGI